MAETTADLRVPPLAALQHRNFRILFVGLLISTIGSQITRVTSAWQIYDLTGSAVALGLAGLFGALPLIPMSLLGGALADAVERRRLMMAMATLALLTVGCLAALTALGEIRVWHLYVANVLITTTGVLDRPSRQALIPSLVPRQHLLNAYTLMTTLIQAGSLLGPVCAGIALVTGGPASAYAIDALTFVVVLGALFLLRVPSVSGGGRKVSLGSIAEGLRFVWSRQVVVGLLGLDIAAMLVGYYPTLLPIFARDILNVGEVGYGLLVAAPAAGSLLGASAMLTLGGVRRPGLLMLGAVAAYGLALLGLGLSTWFPLALFFVALLGVTDAISVSIRHTAVQLATPDELRGRVSSAFQIAVQGGNSLGTVNAGFAASLVGAGPAVAIGGGLVVLTVIAIGRAFQPIREFRT